MFLRSAFLICKSDNFYANAPSFVYGFRAQGLIFQQSDATVDWWHKNTPAWFFPAWPPSFVQPLIWSSNTRMGRYQKTLMSRQDKGYVRTMVED